MLRFFAATALTLFFAVYARHTCLRHADIIDAAILRRFLHAFIDAIDVSPLRLLPFSIFAAFTPCFRHFATLPLSPRRYAIFFS